MLNKTFKKIIKLIRYKVHFMVGGKIFVSKINLVKQMFQTILILVLHLR